jgi:hypothetical protein
VIRRRAWARLRPSARLVVADPRARRAPDARLDAARRTVPAPTTPSTTTTTTSAVIAVRVEAHRRLSLHRRRCADHRNQDRGAVGPEVARIRAREEWDRAVVESDVRGGGRRSRRRCPPIRHRLVRRGAVGYVVSAHGERRLQAYGSDFGHVAAGADRDRHRPARPCCRSSSKHGGGLRREAARPVARRHRRRPSLRVLRRAPERRARESLATAADVSLTAAPDLTVLQRLVDRDHLSRRTCSADSAHRERLDRRIVSAWIGDRDHRSERSDDSLGGGVRGGSVRSPSSFGTAPST